MMKPWAGKGIAFSWGYVGSANSGSVRNPDLLLVEHDTTDDFMLIADRNGEDGNVDIEFDFDTGLALARWILDAVAERSSPEGQDEKKRHIRMSQEHAARMAKTDP